MVGMIYDGHMRSGKKFTNIRIIIIIIIIIIITVVVRVYLRGWTKGAELPSVGNK